MSRTWLASFASQYPSIPKFNFASIIIILASIKRMSNSRHNTDSRDVCLDDDDDDDDDVIGSVVAFGT